MTRNMCSTCSMPGNGLGAWDIMLNKTQPCPQGDHKYQSQKERKEANQGVILSNKDKYRGMGQRDWIFLKLGSSNILVYLIFVFKSTPFISLSYF